MLSSVLSRSTNVLAPRSTASLLSSSLLSSSSSSSAIAAAARRAMSTGEAAYADMSLHTCRQCEQTAHGTGCTIVGVCGKTAPVAAMQDLMLYTLKGVSKLASAARHAGGDVAEVRNITRAQLNLVFATLTNVNFDPLRHTAMLGECEQLLERARSAFDSATNGGASARATFEHAAAPDFSVTSGAALPTVDAAVALSDEQPTGQAARLDEVNGNQDIVALQDLVLLGIKGTMAYAAHVEALGHNLADEAPETVDSLADTLALLNDDASRHTVDDYVAAALEVGRINLKVMELLESAHTKAFGDPSPTRVSRSPVPGKCIAVSGHDLQELVHVLDATKGKGINVYTHGEMLPAHGYPKIREQYPHLVGHYGNAWNKQRIEFSKFPGAVVMTSNCIMPPRSTYRQRIFTTGPVGFEGVEHVDLSTAESKRLIVDAALEAPGYDASVTTTSGNKKYFTTGFGKAAVLGVADEVIDAVKTGKLRHFFLIGGCDGREEERNYFTECALATPQDTVILTLGCGKYRVNAYDHGIVPGTTIPRLIDVGQCNDAFGAIQIANALAGALDTDVNSLPLSFVVSWLEQKAVAVLLTLLACGVRKIRLGPALPAFVTPNMLALLQKEFDLRPIGEDAREDVKKMLAGDV